MRQIELLAPAGSFEALKAALQNGADAVYLGGTEFSARAYASNFDRDTLQEAVEYAHIRGMKVYITINILMKDHEIQGLLEYVNFLYNIDVDAVIVQDLGVMMLIREAFPDLELHCSTQMTLHNTKGVESLKKMGVKRVVLARELSLNEINEIHKKTGMELEAFVHGALCVAYSGQCLMSSFIGGRSGNRGRCAQPCRKPYQLVSSKGDLNNIDEEYHLSMRDLNTFEEIGKLIESGVTSFKIEGRMKKPQYVASIVRSYRQGIDHYLKKGKILKDEGLQKEMAQMFNRKFTKGYIFESPRSEIVNTEKPNNSGIYLGKVLQYQAKTKRLHIKLKSSLSVGDGIEVWQGIGSNEGGVVTAIYVNQKPVPKATTGQSVEIELKGKIQAGADVYKTLDVEMMDELERTYAHQAENKKVLVYGEIKINLGKPMELSLWDGANHHVYSKTDFIVEKAQRVALTEERVIENLSKLGNTPYSLEELKVEIDDGVAVPISVINGLRRDAIDQLTELRKNHYQRNEKEILPQPSTLSYVALGKKSNDHPSPRITAKVDRVDLLKVVLEEDIDGIYYGDFNTLSEASSLCREKGIPCYFRSPSIMKDQDYNRVAEEIKGIDLQGVLAGDLGMINYTKNNLTVPVMVDYSLNTMNSYTFHYLDQLQVQGGILSPELDFKNIKELKINPQLQVEAVVYGKMSVMTIEYCPLQQQKECNHQCDDCRTIPYHYRWGLKDQKQMTFPFGKDCWGRTILLNSQALYMLDKLPEFQSNNIFNYRLEFTDEKPQDIKATINHCHQQMKRLQKGQKPLEVEELQHLVQEGFTRGHYFRGVE
ncbi:DUF3656 domain-containing U32 family peptidase [Alkaliphilus hydrothermalis]|uniref:Protease n=1 Tax=Alkaliphilus hydrothermalis TaxID=1482730 RepID=A0ABS2NSJ2_9FIRM|nr:U32 family peptidase [Alkaliphilus hydrothermalis]MBM7615935.1 putative protease [Alkaliphilus hydrothermalis]